MSTFPHLLRLRSTGLWWLGALVWLLMLASSPAALAQTASVNALIDQACAGTRMADNLGCTANDLTASISFSQPAATAITSCISGQVLSLDAIASLTSGSPNRYNIGLFTGQVGNDPQLNNAANQCSLGVFPTSPAPFTNFDGGAACGDFFGSSTATLKISAIKATCLPAPGTNQLSIPYVLSWHNGADASCTTANLMPNTKSKCNAALASYVVGVYVQGWIKITKQTNPSGATQTFSFSAATSPTASISPASITMTSGQSQTITFPLNPVGGSQYVTLTEVLSSGWESTATIVCTNPSGGAASYITVNNANRTISGTFNGTNYGAICTITNNKQTRVRARKTVANSDTGTFNLSAQSNMATTSATDQGNGGATGYQQSTSGAVTLTETSGSNSSLTKYVSAVTCTNEETGAAITPTASTLTGSTRTVVYTPPSNVDSNCLFTNTRSANLAVSKTDGVGSVNSGGTTIYTLTVTNSGPSDMDGAVLKDPAATGLSCGSVSCSSTSGGAACPSAGNVTIANLQGGSGITLPTVPANSTVSFALSCNVTATGS